MHKQSLFRKAADLFARVPVLKALFIEILASQGVSTILNVAYVTKLSSVIPDDKERAGWSGKVSAKYYKRVGTAYCNIPMSYLLSIEFHSHMFVLLPIFNLFLPL